MFVTFKDEETLRTKCNPKLEGCGWAELPHKKPSEDAANFFPLWKT